MSLTEKHELAFDVVSDISQSVIAAYGLVYNVDGDTRDLMENVFDRDLGEDNADGSWRLPVPATFVLDRKCVVRPAHVDADYRTRMEPAEIIKVLAVLS